MVHQELLPENLDKRLHPLNQPPRKVRNSKGFAPFFLGFFCQNHLLKTKNCDKGPYRKLLWDLDLKLIFCCEMGPLPILWLIPLFRRWLACDGHVPVQNYVELLQLVFDNMILSLIQVNNCVKQSFWRYCLHFAKYRRSSNARMVKYKFTHCCGGRMCCNSILL